MNDKYVVFARQGSKNFIFPHAKIRNPNDVIHFLQENAISFNIDDEILMLTTPFYREKVLSNDIPFDKYPDLILTQKPNIYQRPEYYILICPKKEGDTTFFYLNSIVQNSIRLPPWEVRINPIDFIGHISDNLCNYLIQQYPYKTDEIEAPIIVDENSQPIPQDKKAEEMIEDMKTKRFSIQCSLSESELVRIRYRSKIVDEIQSSEKDYISELQVINDVWMPQFKKFKIFQREEDYKKFNTIENMIQFHLKFLSDLKLIGNSFDSNLSLIFLELSDFFKIVKIYFSNMNSIYSLMKAADSKKIELIMKKQELTKTPISYFVVPCQRIFKYPLFLKSLIDKTPTFHPDSAFLVLAYNAINAVISNIEFSKVAMEDQEKLFQLYSKINQKVDILDPSRRILKQLNVKNKSMNSIECTFYVFNDMVLLTTMKKNEETVIFHSKIEYFHYLNQEIEFYTISVRMDENKTNYSIIEFKDSDDKNEFIQIIETNRYELYNDHNKHNIIYIQKVNLDTFSFHSYCHDSVALNSSILTFGGKSFNGQMTNVNSCFSPEKNRYKYYIPSSCPPARSSHAMATDGASRIFLFGGKDENGYLNDLYEGEVNSNNDEIEWKMIVVRNQNEAESRCGHTMVYYNGELFVFGGRQGDRTLNDILIYSIEKNEWVRPNCDSINQPSPRYHHSACVCGSWMVVHGGKNHQTYNGTYFFDMNEKAWLSFKISGESKFRYGHKSFYMNGYFVFIGGSNDKKELVQPSVINATKDKDWFYEDFEMKGNVPPTLYLFSLACLNRSHFYLYGGVDTSFNLDYMSNFFYTLELPPELNMNTDKSPVPNEIGIDDEFYDINITQFNKNERKRTMSNTPSFFNIFKKFKVNDDKNNSIAEFDLPKSYDDRNNLSKKKNKKNGRFYLFGILNEKVEQDDESRTKTDVSGSESVSYKSEDSNDKFITKEIASGESIEPSKSANANGKVKDGNNELNMNENIIEEEEEVDNDNEEPNKNEYRHYDVYNRNEEPNKSANAREEVNNESKTLNLDEHITEEEEEEVDNDNEEPNKSVNSNEELNNYKNAIEEEEEAKNENEEPNDQIGAEKENRKSNKTTNTNKAADMKDNEKFAIENTDSNKATDTMDFSPSNIREHDDQEDSKENSKTTSDPSSHDNSKLTTADTDNLTENINEKGDSESKTDSNTRNIMEFSETNPRKNEDSENPHKNGDSEVKEEQSNNQPKPIENSEQIDVRQNSNDKFTTKKEFNSEPHTKVQNNSNSNLNASNQSNEIGYESLAREIRIDTTKLLPFQRHKLEQNLRNYSLVLAENKSILATIYDKFIANKEEVEIPHCDIFVKIIDQSTHKKFIIKIESNTSFDAFLSIVSDIIHRKPDEVMSRIMKIYPLNDEFYIFNIKNVINNKISHLSVFVH